MHTKIKSSMMHKLMAYILLLIICSWIRCSHVMISRFNTQIKSRKWLFSSFIIYYKLGVTHVDLNKGGKSVDQKAYQSMIGSLLYLCASRSDIMLSVCMCAWFQSDPRECHLVVVKRILRYLVATPCFRIWYPKGSTFDLIGYSDSDYAGCKIDRKSTSRMCQFLGRSLVSWSSKKQTSVALSTTEVEYVAIGQCCTQLLWMRQTLRDFGYNLSKVPLHPMWQWECNPHGG
jgi:hypothetical protein